NATDQTSTAPFAAADHNDWSAKWRFATSPTSPTPNRSRRCSSISASALATRDRNAELEREPRNTEVTETLSAYLAERTSILLGTAAKSGWPYVQHRGGLKGFVHTLDQHTLAFADYPGNKQYITLGNLAENAKATILAIDHA